MKDLLWAGWRMKYIESAKREGCLFCIKRDEKPGKKSLVLTVSDTCFVMLNAFPYTCGHLMVAPKRHLGSVSALTERESLDLMAHLSLCERLLKKAYRAHGFNIGINLGRYAGAGVLGHLHVHVVPRWAGDVNYMSTVSDTNVLPECLSETYRKLRVALREVPLAVDKEESSSLQEGGGSNLRRRSAMSRSPASTRTRKRGDQRRHGKKKDRTR